MCLLDVYFTGSHSVKQKSTTEKMINMDQYGSMGSIIPTQSENARWPEKNAGRRWHVGGSLFFS